MFCVNIFNQRLHSYSEKYIRMFIIDAISSPYDLRQRLACGMLSCVAYIGQLAAKSHRIPARMQRVIIHARPFGLHIFDTFSRVKGGRSFGFPTATCLNFFGFREGSAAFLFVRVRLSNSSHFCVRQSNVFIQKNKTDTSLIQQLNSIMSTQYFWSSRKIRPICFQLRQISTLVTNL